MSIRTATRLAPTFDNAVDLHRLINDIERSAWPTAPSNGGSERAATESTTRKDRQ